MSIPTQKQKSTTTTVSVVKIRRPDNIPEQMKPVAYNGIAGDFAKKIADHTEADPDAILFQTLVMAGSVLGRGATCEHIAGQPQPLTLYLGVIGAPGDGRKSTSYRVAEALFARIDPDWNFGTLDN